MLLVRLDDAILGRSSPGQFGLAKSDSEFGPYLRRTLWPYPAEAGCSTALFLRDRANGWTPRTGDNLDTLAPLGRPIEFDTSRRHVLLVGEGALAAPLVGIAAIALRLQCEVAFVFHCGADDPLPPHLLAPEIEYHTDPDAPGPDLVAWADRIVASGSPALYRKLAGAIISARYRVEPGLAYVLLDLPMPCGTGDCCACAVDTRAGVALACVDGPFIDLSELDYRRV